MSLKDKKVLIVEDNQRLSRMMHFLFLSRGVDTKIANNGAEALEALQENIPDAIITDLKMPEMDGFEFCHRLKQNEAYSKIPVLVLSDLERERDADRLLSMGVNDYIKKPFMSADILDKVSYIIDGSKID